MKILVISGFLGAGKTTFIKKMSEKTGRDFCVFENEYAQADIDKALLSENSQMNIWELTENCICCSGKQDFAASILTISNTIDPEYLIVEPTGVAKLSSILQNIKKTTYERITLLKPITILDGSRIEVQKKEFADIYMNQIQNTELIVLSKCESMDEKEMAFVKDKIREINPNVEILGSHYSGQDKDWWNMLLGRNMDGTVNIVTNDNEETNLENMSLTDIRIPTMTHLVSFLEMITFGVFGDICRAKGYLQMGDEWVYFEVVDKMYSITGIKFQLISKGVFIGKNLYRSGLREMLTLGNVKSRNTSHKKIQYKKEQQGS